MRNNKIVYLIIIDLHLKLRNLKKNFKRFYFERSIFTFILNVMEIERKPHFLTCLPKE